MSDPTRSSKGKFHRMPLLPPPAIRVLFVEDDAVDQRALLRAVRDEALPYELCVVSSVREAYRELAAQKFDLVITDYSLGDGTALDVLDRAGDVPGIIVTGTGDEETAIRGMRAGAFDYLVKDAERAYLRELPYTVQIALQKKEQERAIRMLSQAIMSIGDGVYITDRDDRVVLVNRAFCDMYRYTDEEITGQRSALLWDARPDDDLGPLERELTAEVTQRTKGGDPLPVSLRRSPVRDASGRVVAMVRVARDMTERNRVEKALRDANAELEQSRAALEHMASHDELTGLYNRRHLNEMLRTEVARATRYRRPLALLMIDVDHFKSINDRFGHRAGDDVLRGLSRLLRAQLRTMDVCARFGGEELTVLLPEMVEDGAMIVAERLRVTIANHAFAIADDEQPITVTVSIGVATLPGDADTDGALMQAADRALYAAKGLGRNRTVACSRMQEQ